MAKQGQIDNGEAFLKQFPNYAYFHVKDLKLRREYNELHKNINFDFVSSRTKAEMKNAISCIKTHKSKSIKLGASYIAKYKISLDRLSDALICAHKEIKSFLKKPEDVKMINKLEEQLLCLSSATLKKLLTRVMDATGIFLENGDTFSLAKVPAIYINLYKELKDRYYANHLSYSAKDRRHIDNAFIYLSKKKFESGVNSSRVVSNYCSKIKGLKEYLEKNLK